MTMSFERIVTVFIIAIAPLPVLAVDGVIEINQTCAVQTGCTPSDAPGFPVTIGAGSYRLTSALDVAEPALIGLDPSSRAVIDFNGFSMTGDPTDALQRGIARQAGPPANLVTIRNGIISEFDGGCIEIGDDSRVEDMTLVGCSVAALEIGDYGQVIDNQIVGGSGQSLVMGASTAYRGNQIEDDAASAITGGFSAGGNVCAGDHCTGPRMRRYYRTVQRYRGAEVANPGNCAPGYHLASLYELMDTTAVAYEPSLGATTADSGEGPPSASIATGASWMRTGDSANSDPGGLVGPDNCSAWTSSSGSDVGTAVALNDPYTNPASEIAPWTGIELNCSLPLPIWCVEDAR